MKNRINCYVRVTLLGYLEARNYRRVSDDQPKALAKVCGRVCMAI